MLIRIEELSKHHQRKIFDCGVAELNKFLQQQARQSTSKQISKTWVACAASAPDVILGYHTITGYSVITPPAHKLYKQYPHPLAAVKLARLAVDQTNQGKRIGERLLVDAIYRTALVAEQISAIGLFVDPMSPEIVSFYQQFGFQKADRGDPSRLEMWLPISNCYHIAQQITG